MSEITFFSAEVLHDHEVLNADISCYPFLQPLLKAGQLSLKSEICRKSIVQLNRFPAPAFPWQPKLGRWPLSECSTVCWMVNFKAETWGTWCCLSSLVGKLASRCNLLVQIDWLLTCQCLVQNNQAVVGHQLSDLHPATYPHECHCWCKDAKLGYRPGSLVLDHL